MSESQKVKRSRLVRTNEISVDVSAKSHPTSDLSLDLPGLVLVVFVPVRSRLHVCCCGISYASCIIIH
jgi:hypothetical protein